MIIKDFGMDTASLAGPLDAKLAAVRQAGFAQVMISASDVVGHPGGFAAGVRAVRNSGLAVTGLKALPISTGSMVGCASTRWMSQNLCWKSAGNSDPHASGRGVDINSRQHKYRRARP
jgi:hypothetical protein